MHPILVRDGGKKKGGGKVWIMLETLVQPKSWSSVPPQNLYACCCLGLQCSSPRPWPAWVPSDYTGLLFRDDYPQHPFHFLIYFLKTFICNIHMHIFTSFMLIARLVSGVHWITDIIGGVLFSAALVMMYHYLCCFCSKWYKAKNKNYITKIP